MGFCTKCGAKLEDNSKFCTTCGSSVDNTNTVSDTASENTAPQNEITGNAIDLRGSESSDTPQEKKYKPLLWASILSIPVMVLMIFAAKLFYAYAMEYSDTAVFFGLLIVSVPFILASIPFLLYAKGKHALSGTNRKMAKGTAPLMYVLAILTVASAMVCGFSGAFSRTGLLGTFSTILFIALAIVWIVYCNAVSNQSGSEAYLCFAKAMMVAFIVSSPAGYLLGVILRALEFALIIIIVLAVAFFLFGGRIIYYRRG